jgi:adenylylsulfate kinase-like enzyme
MSIHRYDSNHITNGAAAKLLRGHRMVFEKFGPMASGKTTKANELAERLSEEGKDVVIIDDIERAGCTGVRVFVKG